MLAKSDGTTLEQHTKDLFSVSRELKKAIPLLENYFDDIPFWRYLGIAILFHDLGKSTKGFQSLMKDNIRYQFRHEVISAIIAKNYTKNELIINGILAHHKNYSYLREKLNEYQQNKKYQQDHWIEKEVEHINQEWLVSFLEKHNIQLSDIYTEDIECHLKKWTIEKNLKKITEREKFQNIFFSAALSICDHNASAGITKIPVLQNKNFSFLEKITPFSHQTLSWQLQENALLIAPTGLGKTESAIGWLKLQLQIRQGRTFYLLPYTASINAMVKRLSGKEEGFADENLVGILHGKAKFFIDEFYEKGEGQNLKSLIEINKKIIKPFKVITPFQILKWAFGVKGFEKGLTELVGSYLIFDEIHIYDNELVSKILFLTEWLMEKLQVKVFIMTATMPIFLQEHIKRTLKIRAIISPSITEMEKVKRHKIKLLPTSIEEKIDFIHEKINLGKNILIVCNTVAKAQNMFSLIKTNNKVLLHSRFNLKDRIEKEKSIQRSCLVQVLIGTQAIEVSLNIDYDILITEIAPIDALLQRFGRVYRKRKLSEKEDANCFVMTEIQKPHKMIYSNEGILERTIENLKKIEKKLLNERDIQELLNNVYEPFELDMKLRKNFRSYLDSLFPFNSNKETEKEFYDQFDGIEVLPILYLEEFKIFIEQKRFLEAEELFVSISRNKFLSEIKKGNITKFSIENTSYSVICLEYSTELGLLDMAAPTDFQFL